MRTPAKFRPSHPTNRRELTHSDAAIASSAALPGEEYKIGPGKPPREYQWKPGQSGNPAGKKPSMLPDLKAQFERALNNKIKLKRGERDEIVTKLAAGADMLIDQFVAGDARARRDVIAFANLLGVDLASQSRKIEQALKEHHTTDDEELLADYFRRHRGRYRKRHKRANGINSPASGALKPNDSAEDPS
jgi:Family of unknown function (DUF5681)